VRDDHRVVVHVDDPGTRRDGLRHLVGAAGRRHAGTDVEELPDPGLRRQELDQATLERAGRGAKGAHDRRDGDQLAGRPAVDLEVIPAAGQVVPGPGDVRDGGIHRSGLAAARVVLRPLVNHVVPGLPIEPYLSVAASSFNM
jgi:hypothetical protein